MSDPAVLALGFGLRDPVGEQVAEPLVLSQVVKLGRLLLVE